MNEQRKAINVTKEQAVILILDNLDGIGREVGRAHDKIYNINELRFSREREQCLSEMNKILDAAGDLFKNVRYILFEMRSEFIGGGEKENEE